MWGVRKAEVKIDPCLGQLMIGGTINLDREQGRGRMINLTVFWNLK